MLKWIIISIGLLLPGVCVAQNQLPSTPPVGLWWFDGTAWSAVSASKPLPVNASVSASVSGFPGATPTTGTPISVTTGGVTGTLPAGTVVVASNVGATNGAYCKLGASATVADQLIPPSSWFAFTVGAATELTCITSASTTTVNMVGGAGLPTGSGGGGGGAVTVSPSALTLVALDVATVTTGGTAVTVLTAGHRNKGGWLQNPVAAAAPLCINEQGTASGTTSAGATTCIAAGQSYTLTPSAGAVSAISSDSSHPFSGMGYN